jgi:unconventional prefoldin RPB5 interactor 1
MSIRAKRVDKIMKTAKEQENISNGNPIIPEDEDPDDAALRQQMLQYSMGEVGAVVAELELDEVDSDDDSGFDYGDDDFDDGEEEAEDKYGRSTGRVVTDKYRQRMLELEQKLGIRSRFTDQAGQKEDDEESNDNSEGIGRIMVKREPETLSSASKQAPSKSNMKERKDVSGEEKKGVRFSPTLDIAQEDEVPASQPTARATSIVEPLGDVVERSSRTRPTETRSARKPSRFKKVRDETVSSDMIPKGPFDVPSSVVQPPMREVPTGPEGATIADKLVERETSSSVIAPDEFDDSMAHQEVADEHQRMRRKFIHREGGFLKEDESVIQPLDEADGGEPLSRFKAARLSGQ